MSKPGRFGNPRRSVRHMARPATVMIGTAAEIKAAENTNLRGTGGATYGLSVCPVCGLEVKLRKDGTLGNHRVGKTFKTSWPCAGAGTTPTATEGA